MNAQHYIHVQIVNKYQDWNISLPTFPPVKSSIWCSVLYVKTSGVCMPFPVILLHELAATTPASRTGRTVK